MIRTLFLALFLAACAPAASGQVGAASGLLAALKSARPGQTIALPPGDYAGNLVKNRSFDPPVTIASADPARPAVLKDLTLVNDTGLWLRDLEFSTVGAPVGPRGPEGVIPFQVLKSRNIRLTRIAVHGDPHGTLATDVSGLLVRNSSNVTVEDSDFSYLHNAFGQADNDHLTVTGNRCHNLRDDCFRGGGTSYLTVTWNRCDSNHPDGKADPDHPDCIQIWGMKDEPDKPGAHDILIAHNLYVRGTGSQTQAVFIRSAARLNLPRIDHVRITGNLVLGGEYNGIYVDWMGPDVEIDHNIIRGFPDMWGSIVVRNASGIRLHDNNAQRYRIEPSTTSRIQEAHDKLAGSLDDRGTRALVARWEADKAAARRKAVPNP
ncbi:MAG: right-handed parallel beta-helix repeat-containing protein [Caulobacteraceae bacterium]